jgi:hypothetical protein
METFIFFNLDIGFALGFYMDIGLWLLSPGYWICTLDIDLVFRQDIEIWILDVGFFNRYWIVSLSTSDTKLVANSSAGKSVSALFK